MNNIFTVSQIEWLTNLVLLEQFNEGEFSESSLDEKFSTFIESNGLDVSEIEPELSVLAEKDLISYETNGILPGYGGVLYNIQVNKSGKDYLEILEAQLVEAKKTDGQLKEIITLIDEIKNANNEKIKEEKTNKFITFISKFSSVVEVGGNIISCLKFISSAYQGIIPYVLKVFGLK